MKTPISGLALRRPASVDEALRMMRDEHCAPIAGATDLYVALNFGTLGPRVFVDVWGLDDLREIVVRGDTLVIGALATYTALIQSPLVATRLPMLVEAARQVGGPQIQNRGTLGGNIANASPAGDALPVLAAVDATVVLRSVDGERRVPIVEFFTGYRTTARRPHELIAAVEVPAVDGRQWFRKVGTRAAQAISKIVMAGVRGRAAPRISFGSMGPTVVRVPSTERVLADGASIDDAMATLRAELSPIDDVRSTAEYRRHVAGTLLRKFWADTA